jgi:hypothetical protein
MDPNQLIALITIALIVGFMAGYAVRDDRGEGKSPRAERDT